MKRIFHNIRKKLNKKLFLPHTTYMYLFTGPFGVTTYGCHINGYTYKNGEMMMWVAKRSPTKQTYPNLLDQFVSQQKRQFGVSERHASHLIIHLKHHLNL